MICRPLGTAALFALVAHALILPPGIASTSSDGDFLASSILDPKNRLIQLPCPSCAFSPKSEKVQAEEGDDDLFWITGAAHDIVLDFCVSDDGERLELYGESIYPPQLHRDALIKGEHLYVSQVPASASNVDIVSGEARSAAVEVTSSGWKTESEVPASPNGDVIIQMKFQILALEGQPMQLDEVEVQMLKTGEGELLILRLDSHQSSILIPLPSHPKPGIMPPPLPELNVPEVEGCGILPLPICRFKNMFEAKIEAMRGGKMPGPCPGAHRSSHHLPSHVKPHFSFGDESTLDHHGRPHHVRPWGRPHHHHDHKHSAVHSFVRSVFAVLIPVMAGISAGLLVSLTGLLIGRLVGFVCMKVSSNDRQHDPDSDARHQLTAEEGKMLLHEDDDTESLPAYEDAPAYEETEKRPV